MRRRLDELGPAGVNSGSGSHSSSKRNGNSGIYGQLTRRLKSLDFQAFRTLVYLWLGAKGYRQIQALRRTASRGRRPIGGPDFLALSPQSPRTRVAIQIRHWQTPVQKRVVDEMRGWMLRYDVDHGLIVTRSKFFPAAQRTSGDLNGKTVSLVPAARLAGSMAGLGLGVARQGKCFDASKTFFRALSQIQIGHRGPRPSSAAALPEARARRPRFWTSELGSGDEGPNKLCPIFLAILIALAVALWIGGAL